MTWEYPDVDLDQMVYIKTWAGRPGTQAVYHHFGETDQRSRCGVVWRAETVEWTERFAFDGLHARPCGRCWFRTWRARIRKVAAQIASEGSEAGSPS